MHNERHDSSCEDIILHVRVPGSPESLEDIEMDVVFRDLFEGLGVGFRLLEENSSICNDGLHG